MKAPAINDLHYSWYLKILLNCTRLLVQFWENFEISLVITYTNFKSYRKGWLYKFQLSLLLAVNTKIAPYMYLDYVSQVWFDDQTHPPLNAKRSENIYCRG